ncbi:MAG TPA: carbamoyltransferase HypF, partial [Chloroflexi bacterium]|nr:carbamoyltransferase HypF [Chloroflexota bacterium]
TNCGPRFTIIQDIPYDRPKTTMAPFEMCEACCSEYENPLDRRFHAQPVACPACGPHIWLEPTTDGRQRTAEPSRSAVGGPRSVGEHAILETQQLLASGKILAIKGLGGFHLACDALNAAAVGELRRRKLRVDKPFALMMPDIETVEQFCHVSEAERELLLSRQRPIVLLERKPSTRVAPAVAPNQNTLGVMLPYTPLHYLLFADGRRQTADGGQRSAVNGRLSALVMTSGNLSEEPIAYTNEEARARLASLADAFLMHNREIQVRCDDSVMRVRKLGGRSEISQSLTPNSQTYPLRRSRGYAPNPIQLPWEAPQILATGPELKNTFCLTKDKYAFLSHHIGDMENYETLQSFEQGIAHFEQLFRVDAEAIACDLHPNYLATRYAQERAQSSGLPLYQIQHHHAHIAACMADNELSGERPVIGVSFDGTGYGDDDAIWGGEFLLADYHGYQRFAHLKYSPLPGGDAATRKPARIALALLWQAGFDWDDDLPAVNFLCGDDMTLLRSMLEHNINSPQTSSVGRLFDAVAALAGVRGEVNYEGQAAIEFEALADPAEAGAYPFDFSGGTLDASEVLHAVVSDLRSGVSVSAISARFHNGLAEIIQTICEAMRAEFKISEVALSGGVWQNMTLLGKTIPRLEQAGFTVYLHRQVPANDGGIALGQAAIASHLL